MSGQKNYFGKDSIRPDFLNPKKTLSAAESGASSSTTPEPAKSLYVGSGNKSSRANTASRLFNASQSGRSRANTRSSRLFGFLSSSRQPKSDAQKSKSFFNPKLLYFSPAILLIGLIAVLVIMIIGSSSLLGPHIEHLFTDSTNTDYTAYNLRSNEVMREILSGKQQMPDYLKDRLAKEGITTNNDGSLSYKDTVITADNFDLTYNNDVNFREAIIHARRGRVATFFDSAAENFYQKLGLSRDVLHDYQTTGDSAADTANYDQLMSEYFDVDSNATMETAATKTTTDSNGNKSTSTTNLGAVSSNVTSSAEAKARASEFLDSVGNITEASSESCAAKTTGDMVATAVASNAKYTYANTFMTVMESISKAMAGEGSNSGINTVLNWFTRSETTTVHDPVTGAESEVTGTPLEAQSVRAVLSGTPIDQSKTKDYSLERAFVATNAATNNINNAAASNPASAPSTCDADQNNDLALSLNARGTPGSSFVRTVIGALLDNTVGSGFKIVASSTLSLLVPSVADVLYSNAYNDSARGIAGGELFGMGAANVNQLAAQQNSGATGASKERVLAYNHANNVTIAQQAEIDRKNYSPFDASNPNTFLGSITSSLLPLAATTPKSALTSANLATSASTLSSISSTALANINPTYADGENTSYLTTFGEDCQKTSDIGAVGNVYCNMIAVNDLSIIDIPESDPTYQKVISESVDYVDGKEVVREGSPLADFITYWTGRYSMPGVFDANIASACEESRTGNIPILSSVIAKLGGTSEYCRSVADGSRYVNSDDNPYWATEKYHQLWVLNTRVKENLGFYNNSTNPLTASINRDPATPQDGTTNPLTAFREKYEASHPLDNSRSGYLARISGLTKHDAETVIAIADYYQRVANYHPEDAYQFGKNSTINQTAFSTPRFGTSDPILSEASQLGNLSDSSSTSQLGDLLAAAITLSSTGIVRHEEVTA